MAVEVETLVVTITAHNFGYIIPFVLLDADGTAYDISALTALHLLVWKYRDVGDIIFTGTIDVDIAAIGSCHYEVLEHDFDIAGTYRLIVEGTAVDTRITWGPAKLIVQEAPHT